MSTLLSRIFGRKKKQEETTTQDDRIDVSALRGLMSPQEFSSLKANRVPAPVLSSNPADLSGSWPMEQVLKVFPSAQRALFQKFHIGGCNSCGYMPHDTLAKVSADHGLESEKVINFIRESANLENDLEIGPLATAELLRAGAIKLLDVRTPQEFEIAHVEGSILVDQSLAQEIVNSWPQDTALVTICHHGVRSLDAAAYLRGHGFHNTRSMKGGIDAWSMMVDPEMPRY